MKAVLALDQFCDVSKVTEANRHKIKWVKHRDKAVAIYPKGTEFEGEMAIQLCRTGQATPSDEECAKELGLSSAQIESLQIEYKMDTLGINRKEDRELYRAGVILGYDKDLNYIHGPNWDAYMQAIQESETLEEDVE